MQGKGKKILIADDEPDILEIIAFNLRKEGYEVVEAKNGKDALELAQKHQPGLIILDQMMPYKTGMEVCTVLRTLPQFAQTLIVMLTALSDDSTQINSFDIGVDDFISKPVSPKVLVSRINALFRRGRQEEENRVLELGQLVIDPQQFMVTVDGKAVVLARKEFELLYMLAGTPGRVFLRNEILNQVWGSEVIVGDRTIDVHIRKIRQKLNLDCITTVKGVGYKFELT
jgi:two-component system, OmpR family, alkaline phosphatase synthesis response regulator PhoP